MAYYQRHLPHWHPEGAALFITWRLHGSLPVSAPEQRPGAPEQVTAGRAFRALDSLLDAAPSGPVWLRNPRVAALIVSILRRGESERNWYRLAAFAVMSNHAHVLLEPIAPVARITHWIKGSTAREANRLLGRVGERFWQHESYDHWARNENEFQRIVRYIEFNPVAAGLVDRIESWPWSSAYAPEPGETAAGQAEACPTRSSPHPTASRCGAPCRR
jgi:putative transposase